MERLIKRFEKLKKASKSLGSALKKFKKLTLEDEYYEEVRDSVIQRFEYSICFGRRLKII